MLLERGVMVVESIRLSPVWPRFEFRSDAIHLSLFFSASRPCSCSLFRLCFSGCSGIPLCIKLQSVRWRIVDEKKKQCGVVLPQDHYLFIYLLTRKVHNFKLLHALRQRRSPSGTRQFWPCSPSWMQPNRSMRRAVRSFQREKQK